MGQGLRKGTPEPQDGRGRSVEGVGGGRGDRRTGEGEQGKSSGWITRSIRLSSTAPGSSSLKDSTVGHGHTRRLARVPGGAWGEVTVKGREGSCDSGPTPPRLSQLPTALSVVSQIRDWRLQVPTGASLRVNRRDTETRFVGETRS